LERSGRGGTVSLVGIGRRTYGGLPELPPFHGEFDCSAGQLVAPGVVCAVAPNGGKAELLVELFCQSVFELPADQAELFDVVGDAAASDRAGGLDEI
jgi:hypothetical protein